MTGRRGRRRKQLQGDMKEMRGYCKVKAEALDRTLWITGFGRGCVLVVRQTDNRNVYKQRNFLSLRAEKFQGREEHVKMKNR